MNSVLKILMILPCGEKKYKRCLCRCPICNKEYILRYSSALHSKYGCRDCYIKKLIKNPIVVKHNMTNTKIYKCWQDMKSRCYYTKRRQFDDYGGRGIDVCKEWKNDFVNFYNWAINNGYKENLSIDRIDVNGNYCPENCRWATAHQQCVNQRKRKDNKSGFVGVSYEKDKKKWRASINVNKHKYNLGSFNTPKEAAKIRDLFIINNKLTEYSLQVLKAS